ncbi:B3 domain-containing transcription factor VRN1, partial [Mucuna pruriens]
MASKFLHKHQERPMHFFKIITASNLQDGKLMIPNKFVEKYGEGLPQTLFLKPPNGAEWKLSLEKRSGKIWFRKGWKEFADYHSLAHGHLLFFRYQRTSLFQVHIFDSTALEIDYPIENTQNRKYNSSLEFLQPGMRSGICAKVDNTMKLTKASPHHTDRKCKGKLITTSKQVTAFDRASCFRPCNPSFLLVMCPSYVRSRHPLYFPSKFSKRHIDLHEKRGDINLKMLSGRVWPARYQIRTVAAKIRFELYSGWKTFAEDNNLKVGDVCIFELIPGTKLTFQTIQIVKHFKVELICFILVFQTIPRMSNKYILPSSAADSGQMVAVYKRQRKEMKIFTTTKSSLLSYPKPNIRHF